MQPYLMAIDQGTTSSRAIIFSKVGAIVSQHQIDLTQSYPNPGWVEQDPHELWVNTLECCRQAMRKASLSAEHIAGIGISNQRETTILWDRMTGKPIYPAIVWQDRRTSEMCKSMATLAIAGELSAKTGLLLDPYFSATKILWLLEQIPGARERAVRGELAFGTVDTYLLWCLTKGKVHATDATNASRTLLFNIHRQCWDEDILQAFQIPAAILPEVRDCCADFGEADQEWFGEKIKIAGIAGDQQAATVGQACFSAGMVKSTYGTGCFVLLNTGAKVVHSVNQLVSTVAYRFAGEVTYGLEGSIFSAGLIVKWLRDTLKIIHSAAETENLAASMDGNEGVYLVPAFTGLGAPYWNADARAAVVGLTRNSGPAHFARAALEAVCYQTRDLLTAMRKDGVAEIRTLRVDGGMVANNWLLQCLANQLQVTVERPKCIETSALGAAYLAGLQVGVYQSLEEIEGLWQLNATFTPVMPVAEADGLYAGWMKAVDSVLSIV